MGRKRRRGGPHGVAVIDKPAGPTSFTVMRQVERRLGASRAGHAGTLDPAASGVLVVLVGEATKLSAWAVGHDKEYLATIALGAVTDTLDATGEVIATAPVPPEALEVATIGPALEAATGTIRQIPPRYSAIKKDGRSLMSRARGGEEFEPDAREVTCHALELVEVDREARTLTVRVHCGKGYYVRSLARDLAESLGTVGHLAALRRTRSGPFTAGQARAPEAIEVADVRPLTEAVADVAVVTLDAEDAEAVGHGRPVAAEPGPSERAILVDGTGRPLAMAERDGTRWKVKRGLRIEA